MQFHSSTKKLQHDQDRGRGKDHDHPSPGPHTKNSPFSTDPKSQSDKKRALTDSEMEEYIPDFSKLDRSGKMEKIRSAKDYLLAELEPDDAAACTQKEAEAMMEILSAKQTEIWEAGLPEGCSGAPRSVSSSFDLQQRIHHDVRFSTTDYKFFGWDIFRR